MREGGRVRVSASGQGGDLLLNTAESAIAHEPDHAAIVRWLSRPSSYPHQPATVDALETHMSRVFIAGDLVYKMKKPIRLEFVDFTSIEVRRQNCERELALNQRLAPGIYREVVSLMRAPDGGFRFDGDGEPIEWLVVMNRLDQERLLNNAVVRGDVSPDQVDELCDLLGRFYRHTPRIRISESELLGWWREAADANAGSLMDPLFVLRADLVRQVVSAEQMFLEQHGDALAQRAREGRILDGHGDLRPEHVHLGQPIRIIDRLEFNARLRWIDPFDEAVFLGMECKRLGAVWIGPHLVDGLARRLGERPPEFLLSFYAGHRATLRARLSIEHMRDPRPRTPERWPRQAREYLALAIEAFEQLSQS
jgi:uncharacterized protein